MPLTWVDVGNISIKKQGIILPSRSILLITEINNEYDIC